MNEFSGQDIIDLREVMARVEELEQEKQDHEHDDDGSRTGRSYAEDYPEEAAELVELAELLDDCKGYGGDEQWRGDWYPATLIADSYFEKYARELAEDIGAIDKEASWPARCIDWEQAASELQQDYTSVDFGDDTYWFR